MMSPQDAITAAGLPLGFPVSQGIGAPAVTAASGETTVTVEARMLGGHQKEAVVHDGADGPRWRLVSDEGRNLGGHDAAPLPLGFFNAGLHADLIAHWPRSARAALVGLSIRNFYWMTGSFARGTGESHAEPSAIRALAEAGADEADLAVALARALRGSPAAAALRTPLRNTFALSINGCRQDVPGMPSADVADAPDPFVTYSAPPRPDPAAPPDVMRKGRSVGAGEVAPSPPAPEGRLVRTVAGISRVAPTGLVSVDTWLELPGVTRFAFDAETAPPTGDARAPSGLALLAAGVAFCFMTQLSRYIEHMKLEIGGIRLVQHWPFATRLIDGGPLGHAGPVHTHLFLNGRAPADTHETLVSIAARTCYLHATLEAPLDPRSGAEVTLR
jgi:uncharacterized OsmC-like protein